MCSIVSACCVTPVRQSTAIRPTNLLFSFFDTAVNFEGDEYKRWSVFTRGGVECNDSNKCLGTQGIAFCSRTLYAHEFKIHGSYSIISQLEVL